MSQHDYVLANQAGAAFRSDLNDALSAVATINSGASAPATTFAYQLWVDTTNGVIKQRNAGNSGWVTLCPVAQPINITGMVTLYANASAPSGYLACNGAAVSRTTYSVLFAVTGTTYGAGDGSTTFNLPNLAATGSVNYYIKT